MQLGLGGRGSTEKKSHLSRTHYSRRKTKKPVVGRHEINVPLVKESVGSGISEETSKTVFLHNFKNGSVLVNN